MASATRYRTTFQESRASRMVVVTLTPTVLARFENGPARLRASALGRPQWLRVPPPTIREHAVVIERAP